MKFLHLSDLHLGKRFNEYSMLEDQDYILREILNILDAEEPDAVLIAGDVYDKAVPSAEAVQLFGDFLFRLFQRRFGGKELEILVISGNHDSPERLSSYSPLMQSNVHLAPVYDGHISPVALSDAFGTVNVYMLPFVKPAHVRAALQRDARESPAAEADDSGAAQTGGSGTAEADAIQSYTDAIRAAIQRMRVNTAERNVLLTHQFVTGAKRSDSEDASVGGADNVDAAVFAPFDYVALGHLHRPQNVGREAGKIRYCGTPLKYSFSEAKQEKSVTVVELGAKGALNVRTVPLIPRRDLRELRGSYHDLTLRSNYAGTAVDDYLRVILTDEEDIPDAMAKLRLIYPHVMALDYDNRRTRASASLERAEDVERKSPPELFAEFYEKQNNQPLSAEQAGYVRKWMERVWEGAGDVRESAEPWDRSREKGGNPL